MSASTVATAALAKALQDARSAGAEPGADVIDVLVAALHAMTKADERWANSNFPGTPSVTNYADAVIENLRNRYRGGGFPW